jgi:glycine oxidase
MRPDVVIVGAGVVGAACAWELAGAGLAVTVVERGQPGGEASGASAGLLSAVSGARADAAGELARTSRELHGPLAAALREETGVDVEHETGGHLELCLSETEAESARRLAADPRLAGSGLAFLDPDELRRREPAVAPAAAGALALPGNGWVHPGRLVAALVRGAARRGARFLLGEPVAGLAVAGDRVVGVRGPGIGALGAGTVVLAAGAWSGGLAGAPPGLATRPVKGQMLALGHVPPLIHHVLLREEIYLVPRASGECLVGATVEEGREDRAVTAGGLAWLLGEALAAVPGLAGCPVVRTWAGLRPGSPDGAPVVGPWPGRPGLAVATGHFRSGILLAPVTARLVRDFVVDGRTALPAAPFLPDRLAR